MGACKDPAVVGRLVLMGLCQATGQVFVQKTIKNHGPILFTLAMTSRQVSSVILSFFIYGHRVIRQRIACVFTVFYMALPLVQGKAGYSLLYCQASDSASGSGRLLCDRVPSDTPRRHIFRRLFI